MKELVNDIFDITWTKGVYGEVVEQDCYGFKKLDWQPDVIFDIGANVGFFTRFARELFPNATIIAIEPHPFNFETAVKFTDPDSNIIFLNKAIGKGKLLHHGGNATGGNQVYTSPGLGYPEEAINMVLVLDEEHNELGNMTESSIETILPAELIKTYVKEGDKVFMKIDCEGGENAIFEDQESLDAMKKLDHIVMELHFHAISGGSIYDEMKEKTFKALEQFNDTHNCELTNISFTAIKKK